MRLISSLAIASLLVVLPACNSRTPAPPKSSSSAPETGTAVTPADDSKAPAPSAAAASAPTGDPGTPITGPKGRLEGVVKFVGDEIPKSTLVSNLTDPQICGAEMSKMDIVISPENRGIRNVLLWLDNVELPADYKPPTSHLIIDNLKCQFEPHAAAITVGSTVQAKNSDEVYHTTHFYGDLNENPPLPEKGSLSKSYKVRRPGMMNVKCDKHGWMQAYVLVNKHPFHAVTDLDGNFGIADIPAGAYTLKIWHEHFGIQEREVTVTDGETAKFDLTYSNSNG